MCMAFYVTKRTYVRKGPLAMNKNELLEYIDTNSTAITIFKDKIRTEQEAKIISANLLNAGTKLRLNVS